VNANILHLEQIFFIMSRKLGLLTCQKLPNLIESDQALIPLLADKDILGEAVIWDDQEIDWSQYDALLIRNTWDYFEKIPQWLSWLDKIESLNLPMINSVKTVRYNMDKHYLNDLATKGISIVPSIFIDIDENQRLYDIIMNAMWPTMVIKPTISAGAFLTSKFSIDEIDEIVDRYTKLDNKCDLVLQPYLPEIETSGEISLIYFNATYSHGVRKTPKVGDFRIQSQFGGIYQLIEVDDRIIEFGKKALVATGNDCLYGRVDLVMIGENPHIMEVELIEPDLYFEHFPSSKELFVSVLIQFLGRRDY
jgi:glutathione synthase/RimK-type ligase-like ATP-grasp enzyme